jgi:hypothetical protein
LAGCPVDDPEVKFPFRVNVPVPDNKIPTTPFPVEPPNILPVIFNAAGFTAE